MSRSSKLWHEISRKGSFVGITLSHLLEDHPPLSLNSISIRGGRKTAKPGARPISLAKWFSDSERVSGYLLSKSKPPLPSLLLKRLRSPWCPFRWNVHHHDGEAGGDKVAQRAREYKLSPCGWPNLCRAWWLYRRDKVENFCGRPAEWRKETQEGSAGEQTGKSFSFTDWNNLTDVNHAHLYFRQSKMWLTIFFTLFVKERKKDRNL